MPIKLTTTVNEETSCRITFQLVQYDGTTGIASTDLTSAKMWLHDRRTGTVINNRDGVTGDCGDMRPYFNATGNFSFDLTSADNIIFDNTRRKKNTNEEHIMTLQIVSSVSGTVISLTESISILVKNVMFIT